MSWDTNFIHACLKPDIADLNHVMIHAMFVFIFFKTAHQSMCARNVNLHSLQIKFKLDMAQETSWMISYVYFESLNLFSQSLELPIMQFQNKLHKKSNMIQIILLIRNNVFILQAQKNWGCIIFSERLCVKVRSEIYMQFYDSPNYNYLRSTFSFRKIYSCVGLQTSIFE